MARKAQPTGREVLGSSLHVKRHDVNLSVGPSGWDPRGATDQCDGFEALEANTNNLT